MNWNAATFDWNQARAFLATVEEGSLSAAARALGLTQPTLGRQIAALEQDLDILLFERVGKRLVLTRSGLELLAHVRTMFDAANQISLFASGQSQTIEGKIRITASDVMSAILLPPAIARLRKEAPLLEVEIIATNDISDLQHREADIAIRHVRPEQPELIAKFIGEASAYFYAAKSYLKRMGTPVTLADLSQHEWIGFSNNDTLINSLNPLGVNLTAGNFKVGSANGFVAWETAKHGLGVIVMSKDVAENSDMVRLIPNMDPLMYPVWLTAHKELHTSRRVRVVFDLLADFLHERMIIGG